MSKKKIASSSVRADSDSELDFEQALKEVEQIAGRLEGGQLGLSESLQQYEAGIRQLKVCHELLDAAEQRVNALAGFDADGNPVLEPLEEMSAGRAAGSIGGRTRRSALRRISSGEGGRQEDSGRGFGESDGGGKESRERDDRDLGLF